MFQELLGSSFAYFFLDLGLLIPIDIGGDYLELETLSKATPILFTSSFLRSATLHFFTALGSGRIKRIFDLCPDEATN